MLERCTAGFDIYPVFNETPELLIIDSISNDSILKRWSHKNSFHTYYNQSRSEAWMFAHSEVASSQSLVSLLSNPVYSE